MHNRMHGPVNIFHHVPEGRSYTKALYESSVSPFVLTSNAESGCTMSARKMLYLTVMDLVAVLPGTMGNFQCVHIL